MLIATATNVTPSALARPDGTADYHVWVGLNQHCIWRGEIKGHVRSAGAAALLRLIAAAVESESPAYPGPTASETPGESTDNPA